MLAVYQITFMEVSGPAEASDYRISAAVVFSIQQKFLNARLSLDGALLATCDERSLFLINVNTGDTLEWNNSTDHFTGDLCHVDEFTVVALSGHYRLVTICVPPIFRRSTRSPGSPSTSDVISDNEIHLILLPNLEMVGGLVGTMRRLWLLSPESGLGINKKITPYRRSIDVALTVNDTHIQFSKINLNLPSHSSTVLNPHSSEADNSSSQSAADSGDIMRTEFPVVNSSDPSMPVFTLRQPHQRTIAYRAYSSAADRYESWIHVIGVDRPGMSRQLSFPPECVNVEPWRIEEEAGVIISRGSVEGDEPFSFLWFV
ncbi:hypothetical protein FRC17_011103 [Serendipita sp. 399]|nr:hypothetical protein FRC17_011103 [Serendipita sp. 399]